MPQKNTVQTARNLDHTIFHLHDTGRTPVYSITCSDTHSLPFILQDSFNEWTLSFFHVATLPHLDVIFIKSAYSKSISCYIDQFCSHVMSGCSCTFNYRNSILSLSDVHNCIDDEKGLAEKRITWKLLMCVYTTHASS